MGTPEKPRTETCNTEGQAKYEHEQTGKEAEIVDAAPRLGIAPGTLTDTLHGKRKISRQMIRKWKKILIVCYPHGWKKYVRIFEQRAARLP